MKKCLVLVLITAVLALPQGAPFSGMFAGDNLSLTLSSPGAGAYTGEIVFGGQKFPVTAREAGGKLTGSFSAGADRFSFTVTAEQGRFRFVTDNTEYWLSRPAPASSPAPGNVHRTESGMGVRLPAGWTATNNPQGVMLMPRGVAYDPNRQDNPEVYVMDTQDGFEWSNEQQIVKELSSAFVQSGAQIIRGGDRQTFQANGRQGVIYHWEFRSPGMPAMYGLNIYLTAVGSRAYVALAAGEAARIQARDADLRSLVATADFQPPRMPEGGPLADTTPAARMWLQKLRGKVIKQFIGGGGVVGERVRFLAADGTYSMRSSSAVAIDVGPYGGAPTASASSISRNSQTGRWKIRDNGGRIFLQIWTPDGQMSMLPITTDSRNWYLNGEKAFAVDP